MPASRERSERRIEDGDHQRMEENILKSMVSKRRDNLIDVWLKDFHVGRSCEK